MNAQPTSLAEAAREKGVEYFLVSFTDLFGLMRAKLVPASAIGEMEAEGAGFAGFAVWLDMTPAHPDMFAMPDPSSMIQLPWNPSVAWVASDLHMEGKPVEQAPRVALRRAVERAASNGYRMRHGVECEYFVITPEGDAIADPRDRQVKPCYDTSALMRRFDLISEICDSMQALGWEPYQNDHEDACGQFEMNWDYADALVTADRHAFFKFMVKSLAEKHGLRATFMPKPFPNLTGNGCHAHVSLWNTEGDNNLFEDSGDELGLSSTAYHFLAGLLQHAPALCAILNPTVNSYKRLNAPPTASGATWSPNTATWSGNNRTHMIRIPAPGRMEIRLGDGATNPYLLPAALLAAGQHGIVRELMPSKRLDFDMYATPQRARGARKLPLNLLDALRALKSDRILTDATGRSAIEAFLNLKQTEWDDYARHLTSWERENTLDC